MGKKRLLSYGQTEAHLISIYGEKEYSLEAIYRILDTCLTRSPIKFEDSISDDFIGNFFYDRKSGLLWPELFAHHESLAADFYSALYNLEFDDDGPRAESYLKEELGFFKSSMMCGIISLPKAFKLTTQEQMKLKWCLDTIRYY